MRVFDFSVDPDYQRLNSTSLKDDMGGFYEIVINGNLQAEWTPPDFFVENPLELEGSFLALANRLVGKPEFRNSSLYLLMERYGQFIDVTVERIPGYCLWIPSVERDVFDFDAGLKPGPMSYEGVEIKRELLMTPQVFRIPEFQLRQYLSTGYRTVTDDFYVKYHELGLTGLKFKLVWEGYR